MELSLLEIIFILFLLDAIGAVWVAWCGRRWFIHNFGVISRWFPPAKGWALYYFVWVLVAAYFAGVLSF